MNSEQWIQDERKRLQDRGANLAKQRELAATVLARVDKLIASNSAALEALNK